MKQLLNEIQASAIMEYGRAKEKFGRYNNSDHESYAVILEEFEEAHEQAAKFKLQLACFWDMVKLNKNNEALEWLNTMRKHAEQAAAEWVQVAAMCYKAQQRKGDENAED